MDVAFVAVAPAHQLFQLASSGEDVSLRWKLCLLYVIVLSRVPRAPLFTQGLLRHTVGLFFSLLVPARRIGAPSSLSL